MPKMDPLANDVMKLFHRGNNTKYKNQLKHRVLNVINAMLSIMFRQCGAICIYLSKTQLTACQFARLKGQSLNLPHLTMTAFSTTKSTIRKKQKE